MIGNISEQTTETTVEFPTATEVLKHQQHSTKMQYFQYRQTAQISKSPSIYFDMIYIVPV